MRIAVAAINEYTHGARNKKKKYFEDKEGGQTL